MVLITGEYLKRRWPELVAAAERKRKWQEQQERKWQLEMRFERSTERTPEETARGVARLQALKEMVTTSAAAQKASKGEVEEPRLQAEEQATGLVDLFATPPKKQGS